jgi:hypothetical protein
MSMNKSANLLHEASVFVSLSHTLLSLTQESKINIMVQAPRHFAARLPRSKWGRQILGKRQKVDWG